MTKKEEVDVLYSLGTTKKKGWQQHDNPCLSEDYGDLESAWNTVTSKMTEEQRGELIQTIKLAIQAQAIFRRDSRRAGDFVPQPKLIASWIRKKRWRNQIESHADIGRDNKRTCGCGKPINHAHSGTCWDCYNKKHPYSWDKIRKQHAVERGLTQKDVENCKRWLREQKLMSNLKGGGE